MTWLLCRCRPSRIGASLLSCCCYSLFRHIICHFPCRFGVSGGGWWGSGNGEDPGELYVHPPPCPPTSHTQNPLGTGVPRL